MMENSEPVINSVSPPKHDLSAKSHPLDDLLKISAETGYQLEDIEFARHMDSIDPLRHLRDEFCYPKMKTLGKGRYHNVDNTGVGGHLFVEYHIQHTGASVVL